jgi:subtilisin family serine protease
MNHDTKSKKLKREKIKRSLLVRSKLDPRLSFLLSLSRKKLIKLKEHEDGKLIRLYDEIQTRNANQESNNQQERSTKSKELYSKLFTPITAGVYLPRRSTKDNSWPVKFNEPYISAFILSDASSKDLSRLGVKVRCQAGDIFTAFIPFSVVPRLTSSPAIRFIEIARLLFSTLDQTIPFTQINSLHSAEPPINGSGVIVGIIDIGPLDIYHPDFRTVDNATRVLFLWDQQLLAQGAEAGPPTDPALPGFTPLLNMGSYGVEYDETAINSELNNYNLPTTPAYQIVRHSPPPPPIDGSNGHGTFVTGCAVGNGSGQAGTFTGAAPAADIIYVHTFGITGEGAFKLAAESSFIFDGFSYIFSRAAQLGKPCVINLSVSDNQGPHDGSALGEQFLDTLLLVPGRAATISAGNSNNTGSHAAGNLSAQGTVDLILNYSANAMNSDGIEIWYDGHDRFNVLVTVPTDPAITIGPVVPGGIDSVTLPGSGIIVSVNSVLIDPRNGDNLIYINIIINTEGQSIPVGNWTITLTGTAIINGSFQAWVDLNNRGKTSWQPPYFQEDHLTVGVPSTSRRAITVGNHDKITPTPTIATSSGCGPTRDGRIKPEIATVGTNITATSPRNMNSPLFEQLLYQSVSGTSFSAPLVAGACALIFQCRGSTSTWANLKQVLEDTAGTAGLSIPSNTFGFGFMQVANTCLQPTTNIVDVWLRDGPSDTGLEPFTDPVYWLSPDIQVLDTGGIPVPNPSYNPNNRFNNIIRVTARNRGTQIARNTEVYLYWADPATHIPFPAKWQTIGIYTGSPEFLLEGNKLIIPELGGNDGIATLDFAWAPPEPGNNLRGDDHFCLLVRLENEGDESQIDMGGWSSITAKNNLALHNVHVQNASGSGNADMSFYVVGSSSQDSLIIYTELVDGRVTLNLPIEALPWRDIQLIERYGQRRPEYGCADNLKDPLTKMKHILKKDEEVQMWTDILGAKSLELGDGIASIVVAGKENLFIPCIRITEGIKMPAKIHVERVKIDKEHRFVHIAQLSGGQRAGGVSLELTTNNDET